MINYNMHDYFCKIKEAIIIGLRRKFVLASEDCRTEESELGALLHCCIRLPGLPYESHICLHACMPTSYDMLTLTMNNENQAILRAQVQKPTP
jgi:hypothetical protein